MALRRLSRGRLLFRAVWLRGRPFIGFPPKRKQWRLLQAPAATPPASSGLHVAWLVFAELARRPTDKFSPANWPLLLDRPKQFQPSEPKP